MEEGERVNFRRVARHVQDYVHDNFGQKGFTSPNYPRGYHTCLICDPPTLVSCSFHCCSNCCHVCKCVTLLFESFMHFYLFFQHSGDRSKWLRHISAVHCDYVIGHLKEHHKEARAASPGDLTKFTTPRKIAADVSFIVMDKMLYFFF